ncbi:BglG family transcription antiterminator [Caenibacillus caldisaponilyticus]|uniref:BglG family transcription antiterminator n=1 Tax=Caenibacillus caldisaponilyticus TaxID=1674942 RepID=UPI0009884D7B|nr:PRD domain-containing protein [Caenibacillus caldisaponilyticus]
MAVIFESDKHLQILDMIDKKDYLTPEYLAKQVKISQRSVFNYIDRLNADLEGIAAIRNKRGKGYFLTVFDRQKFKEVIRQNKERTTKNDSLIKRIAFIVGCLIRENGINTLDELAYELNLGRSTLVKDLKKASVLLNPYDLKIAGKPNKGLKIEGSELSLRIFIIEHLYEYLYSHSAIEKKVENALQEIIKKCDLEAATEKRFVRTIVVMLDRLQGGHRINLEKKYQKLFETTGYGIAREVAMEIERHFSIYIPVQEVLFLTIPIVGRRTPTDINSVANITVPPEITDLLNTIVNRIDDEMNILLDLKNIERELEYHLFFMVNRLIFGIHSPNPLLNQVREKYPLAFKMAEIAGEVIHEKIDLKPSLDELGYLALYFEISLSENDFKIKSFQRVAVICGTGRGSAKLISIQLRKILGNKPVIDLYSDKEADPRVLSKYDMVFTTVPLNYSLEAPVIKIDEIFDEAKITRQIENLVYLQSRHKMETPLHDSSLLSILLSKERFYVLDSKDYFESVLFMARDLVEKGFADSGFPGRLIQREEKSTMVYDHCIALPHTVNFASSHIIVSVGIFPKEIFKDEKPIKIIFLLALPEKADEEEALLIKVYDEIMRISQNEKWICQLSDCLTFEKFLLHLGDH